MERMLTFVTLSITKIINSNEKNKPYKKNDSSRSTY
jgi:hypothetical protein